jgi:LPXTG-motif cell wall-anchored protein
MEINYFTLTIIGVLMVALVVWLVIRNRKDEKAFEKDEIDSSAIEPRDPAKD